MRRRALRKIAALGVLLVLSGPLGAYWTEALPVVGWTFMFIWATSLVAWVISLFIVLLSREEVPRHNMYRLPKKR